MIAPNCYINHFTVKIRGYYHLNDVIHTRRGQSAIDFSTRSETEWS